MFVKFVKNIRLFLYLLKRTNYVNLILLEQFHYRRLDKYFLGYIQDLINEILVDRVLEIVCS